MLSMRSRMAAAKSQNELDALFAEANEYKSATKDTRRKWSLTIHARSEELGKPEKKTKKTK